MQTTSLGTIVWDDEVILYDRDGYVITGTSDDKYHVYGGESEYCPISEDVEFELDRICDNLDDAELIVMTHKLEG